MTTQTQTQTRTIKARARFFSGYGLETLSVRVEPDGTIRVWDSVAEHYTACHSLSPSAVRRIRRLARSQQ